MKMPKYSLEGAKHLVVKNIGEEISFRSKVARGKYYEDKGKITAAYQNIFTVEINRAGDRELLSFPYSDIVNSAFTLKETKEQNQTI